MSGYIRKFTTSITLPVVFFLFISSSFSAELTLGLVKAGIKKGMSQSEVLEVLGSPNMVTNDRSGNEVWTYDKISSTVVTEGGAQNETDVDTKSESVGGGVFLGILGAFGSKGNSQSKAESDTQYKSNVTVSKKTLTVIIKFDDNYLVKSTKTHMTKF